VNILVFNRVGNGVTKGKRLCYLKRMLRATHSARIRKVGFWGASTMPPEKKEVVKPKAFG